MVPFDPLHKLNQLCRRHGLPEELGLALLPLLERVATSRPDLRERALAFVDRQLSRLARERACARLRAEVRNEACLRAVAPLLHDWRPEREG